MPYILKSKLSIHEKNSDISLKMSDKTSTNKGYFGFVLILKPYLFLQVWDFCNENLHKVIMLWIYLKQMEEENLYMGQNVQNITILWNLPQNFTTHYVFILSYLQILKDIFKKWPLLGFCFVIYSRNYCLLGENVNINLYYLRGMLT